MENEAAISILTSLAEGGSFDANTVDALHAGIDALRSSRARPAAAGARWTDDEDAQLCREFDDGLAVAQLAELHNRSRTAVSLRLVKLGRLEADSVRARGRGKVV